jgi:hypothetical protein
MFPGDYPGDHPEALPVAESAAAMTTALWIDGLDARATYGLQLGASDGARDLPTRRLDTITIPDVPGATKLGAPAIEPRSLTLTGVLQGSTAVDVRTKRDLLFAVLRRGRVTLRLADAPTRELPIEILTTKMASTGAQQLARTLPISIDAVALDPFWRDVTPTVVAISTTPGACPLGTAPVAPVIVCTAPGPVLSLTLRTALGDAVTVLQLAGLEPAVPLTIDCAARTIRQGAVSMIAALVSGDFPVLDAITQGDYAASAWPTLAVSQGTASVTYTRRWA